MAFTYTVANLSSQGNLPSAIVDVRAMTWDGQQLVFATNESGADRIRTLARNANGSYTPANNVNQGNLPSAIERPEAMTWDGMQLVIIQGDPSLDAPTPSNGRLSTLSRNTNNSYTTSNAVQVGEISSIVNVKGMTWDGMNLVLLLSSGANDVIWLIPRESGGSYPTTNTGFIQFATTGRQGVLPASFNTPAAMTWDGFQLLIGESSGTDEVWRLPRNSDGTYTPANATKVGDLSGTQSPAGFAFDDRQLVIADNRTGVDRLYVLPPDNAPPVVAVSAMPLTIDHQGTTSLIGVATDINNDPLTYSWTSSHGGTFSNPTGLVTMWTAPASLTDATVVDLTFTASDAEHSRSATVSITVRAQTVVPLALADPVNQANTTGDVIDLPLPAASGGVEPYIYTITGLPDGLIAMKNRITGIPQTPGAFTVTYKVTDSNQDMVTRDFTWAIAGPVIPPPVGLNLRIDWGGLHYANANADVTGRITSDIRCRRGRGTGASVLARSQAGILTCQLDNSDGLFDNEDTSSPLAGFIRPGVQVQLRDGADVLWTGVLDSLPTDYKLNGQHRARLTAYGILSTTQEPDVAGGSLNPEPTTSAFAELVTSADIPIVPSTGTPYVMSRWWEIGKLRRALERIEDTEGGFVYETREGELGLQTSGHRAAQTVGQVFTGTTPEPGQIRILGNPRRETRVKDVHNEVIGTVRQFETRTAQTLFVLEQPLAIGLGETVRFSAEYPIETGGVSELDSLVAGTDYTANTEADGTGSNRTSSITVTPTIGDFNEIEVTASYPVQMGQTQEATVYLRGLTIKGSVLTPSTPLRVVRQDPVSRQRYRPKTLTLRNTWIRTVADMETRADAILGEIATPERRIKLDWHVESWATFRGLELSDKVQVRMPGFTSDGFIESIGLRLPLSGVLPVCTLDVSLEG